MYSVLTNPWSFLASWLLSIDQVIGPNGLLSTKARIVVTNSIAFLRQFDKLVYLRRGIILESGSYEELLSDSGSELYKLV